MKATFALIAAILLTACNPPPTPSNDEVIAQTKKCRAAGMVPRAVFYGGTGGFAGIQCRPTKKEEEQ